MVKSPFFIVTYEDNFPFQMHANLHDEKEENWIWYVIRDRKYHAGCISDIKRIAEKPHARIGTNSFSDNPVQLVEKYEINQQSYVVSLRSPDALRAIIEEVLSN